jgi:chromosome segregation ATPase
MTDESGVSLKFLDRWRELHKAVGSFAQVAHVLNNVEAIIDQNKELQNRVKVLEEEKSESDKLIASLRASHNIQLQQHESRYSDWELQRTKMQDQAKDAEKRSQQENETAGRELALARAVLKDAHMDIEGKRVEISGLSTSLHAIQAELRDIKGAIGLTEWNESFLLVLDFVKGIFTKPF